MTCNYFVICIQLGAITNKIPALQFLERRKKKVSAKTKIDQTRGQNFVNVKLHSVRENLVTGWILQRCGSTYPHHCGSPENTSPCRISKSDLVKVKDETNAGRQNSKVGFHPLPNAEIPDPCRFGGRDPCGSGYHMLPKGSEPKLLSHFNKN